jgi:hypothetical protein
VRPGNKGGAARGAREGREGGWDCLFLDWQEAGAPMAALALGKGGPLLLRPGPARTCCCSARSMQVLPRTLDGRRLPPAAPSCERARGAAEASAREAAAPAGPHRAPAAPLMAPGIDSPEARRRPPTSWRRRGPPPASCRRRGPHLRCPPPTHAPDRPTRPYPGRPTASTRQRGGLCSSARRAARWRRSRRTCGSTGCRSGGLDRGRLETTRRAPLAGGTLGGGPRRTSPSPLCPRTLFSCVASRLHQRA